MGGRNSCIVSYAFACTGKNRKSEFQKKTLKNWVARHREFHLSLISGCGSDWLLQSCETLRVLSDRYRYIINAPTHGTPPAGRTAQTPSLMRPIARDAQTSMRIAARAHSAVTRYHHRRKGRCFWGKPTVHTPQRQSPIRSRGSRQKASGMLLAKDRLRKRIGGESMKTIPADPYPWPFDGSLSPQTTCLIGHRHADGISAARVAMSMRWDMICP